MANPIYLSDCAFPTGMLVMWTGAVAPRNWLLCDGAAVSRTLYADLYNVIKTNYGAGDMRTTFNLPDLRTRVPVGFDANLTDYNRLGLSNGASSINLVAGQLPPHVHLGTTNLSGDHTHTVSTTSAGDHTHTGTTADAGSHTHTVTSDTSGAHTHTASTATAGSHSHTWSKAWTDGGYVGTVWSAGAGSTLWYSKKTGDQTVNTASGGGHSHTVTINNGGAHSHTFTVAEAAAHNHTVTLNSGGSHTHTVTVAQAGAHTHAFTTGAGPGASANIDIRNRFVVVNYIIKT
jgi:microcystin-dependent protein